MGSPLKNIIVMGALGVVVFSFTIATIQERQAAQRFNSLSPAQHLAEAKRLLSDFNYAEAAHHLEAVPSNAPDRAEADKVALDIRTTLSRQEMARQAEQQQHEQPQQGEGEQSEWLSSYVPKTVRVQTDMNSLWVNQEERICTTYPDNDGTVAVVHCGTPGSVDDHNIPVTFWGSVKRAKSSEWKCRREGEDFVCRAVN